MWIAGRQEAPILWKAGLVLLRVEYAVIPEPLYIREFRGRWGAGLLAHFTWIPVQGEPQQAVFLRRRYVPEFKVFDLELVVWDRLDDQIQHVVIDGKTFNTLLAVWADMKNHPDDPRASAFIRQDRKAMAARAGNGESPEWYEVDGKWYKEETAFVKAQREQREAVKAIKGGEGVKP